ncbi:MAG: hypothetical protein VB980_00850 [Opitutales bacterium]
MTHTPTDAKVENFFAKLGEGFAREASQLRELVTRACALGLHPQTGKNESNLHLKNASGVNFGCVKSNGRFRNYSSKLTGEQYLDDLGHLLACPVFKGDNSHFWSVWDEAQQSIPLDDFLAFGNEWLELVAAWLKKNG